MLNNRELAIGIWMSLIAILAIARADVRRSAAGVLGALFNWKIVTCVAAMIAYNTAIVSGLFAIGFWQFSMIKDTVVWFCFTGFAMALRHLAPRNRESVLRTVLSDNLKVMAVLEFLVGTYVLSLPAELILVPFVIIIVVLDSIAELNDECAILAKITSSSLALIGLAMIGFAVSRAIGDFRTLGTMNTARSVVFPPLMSIAFIPFIYALTIVAAYESIFIRLTLGRAKTPDVIRYSRRRIITHCGLSVRRLREILERPPIEMMQIESIADAERLFSEHPGMGNGKESRVGAPHL